MKFSFYIEIQTVFYNIYIKGEEIGIVKIIFIKNNNVGGNSILEVLS